MIYFLVFLFIIDLIHRSLTCYMFSLYITFFLLILIITNLEQFQMIDSDSKNVSSEVFLYIICLIYHNLTCYMYSLISNFFPFSIILLIITNLEQFPLIDLGSENVSSEVFLCIIYL
jgi:hypothetical protein